MRLLPIHCDSCARSLLTPINRMVAGVTTCTVCGGTARTLSRATHGLEDQVLFNELSLALREASVTRANAERLMADLREHGAALPRLVKSLPSLARLQLRAGDKAELLRKAEGMLLILLEAVASSSPVTRARARTRSA
jgi:hypothetical protein